MALQVPRTNGGRLAVIYEIYPRSFQVSNGDGIGDLNGITSRLGYLQDLGADAIWITPIYPSPQVDFGYDISDYKAIDPQYGTMADFDHLIAEAKKHRIRVIVDFVPNHTSDQHPWFQASRSSRNNPKRDWYIWREGKAPGQPPNKWLSWFGHCAWAFDPATGQHYCHFFYPQQADLNWRNPEVRDVMFDVLRFWRKRGVAVFALMRCHASLKIQTCAMIPFSPAQTRMAIRIFSINIRTIFRRCTRSSVISAELSLNSRRRPGSPSATGPRHCVPRTFLSVR
jgi:Alpha amylase, catalytic domain